ncbi:MAG TPA: Na-translocating system protein MpsC family protein [Conexibacter sp.]
MSGLSEDRPATASLAANISNVVVRLLSEFTGRGPTKARTYIQDELITVVLQDTLTRGEHSLVRDGEQALVLAMRKAYQNTMETALTEAVETISGREVIAFLSDNHIDPDFAIESFVLAPRGNHAAG